MTLFAVFISFHDSINKPFFPPVPIMNFRIRNLRKSMKKSGIRALFVTNPLNIEYITGLKVSVGVFVITSTSSLLFVDKRYLEEASKRAKSSINVYEYNLIREKLQSLSTLWIESDSLTVEEYLGWKKYFKNKKIVHTFDLIKGLRRTKEPNEIKKILRASSITKSVLRKVPSMLSHGITEKHLATMIEVECRKRGADSMAFETIVGFGSNTSKPHHHPTNRKLRAGDLVQIDMGAKVGGYCSDFSRIFVTGSLTSFEKKSYRALKEAKKCAEQILRAGVSVHRLDEAARSVLRRYGFEDFFPHALGHGVGLEIHDGIVLSSKKTDFKLKKGDVVTIEPGIYFPGKFGMRIEDTHIIL